MNKTININLASTFFHIDENAYSVLRNYLSKLKTAFKNTSGSEEILQDIEIRIAELFQEAKKHTDYVINEEDVQKVISILGQPEDMDTEDNFESVEKDSLVSTKKLYRDPEDKYIGGVISGLGYFFGIDSTWLRIFWFIATLFSGGTLILIYILLWALIPLAKSTADKLKMKGEPVNIATIEKKIKEEFDEVSSKIKDIDYKKASNTLKKKSRKFFNFVEELILLIPKIIFRFIGITFLIISIIGFISVLLGWASALFFSSLHWPFKFYLFNLNWTPSLFISIAFLLFILIPFLFLFFLGLRLLSSKASKLGSTVRNSLAVLWLITLIGLVGFGAYEIRSNSVKATKEVSQNLILRESDTLWIKQKNQYFNKNEERWVFKNTNVIIDPENDSWWIDKNLKLNIETTDLPNPVLVITKSAHGYDPQEAQKHADKIQYQWNQVENNLLLNTQWNLAFSEKFHNQEVKLVLQLPKGYSLFIDPSLKNYLTYPIANDQGYRSSKTAGHYWVMGDQELECLDCDSTSKSMELRYQQEDKQKELHLKVDENEVQINRK